MAGIDVGVNVHRTNAHRYPPDPTYYQADVALHAAGRLGQKTGRGLLSLREGRSHASRRSGSQRASCARRAAELAIAQRAHSDEEILERCLFPVAQRGHPNSRRGHRACVPATSTWCGARATASRAIAAARCSTRDTIGLPACSTGMQKYRDDVRPHALGAGAVAGAPGARRAYASRTGRRSAARGGRR